MPKRLIEIRDKTCANNNNSTARYKIIEEGSDELNNDKCKKTYQFKTHCIGRCDDISPPKQQKSFR